jgi:hypothetical protein
MPTTADAERSGRRCSVRCRLSCRSRISLLRLPGWPDSRSSRSSWRAGARLPDQRREHHAGSRFCAVPGTRSRSPRPPPRCTASEPVAPVVGRGGRLGARRRHRRGARRRHRLRYRLVRHHPDQLVEAVNAPDLREVAVAGHSGDIRTARAGLASADPAVRAAALGALERLEQLDDDTITRALDDPDVAVRRRAAEIAATHPSVDLLGVLDDPDDRVIEVAAWACGEHESRRDAIVERLVDWPQPPTIRWCGNPRSQRSERSATLVGLLRSSRRAPTNPRCADVRCSRSPRSTGPRSMPPSNGR